MRKGHLQVIEKAKENEFPAELVLYLTKCTDTTIAVLNIIYRYFYGRFHLEPSEALIKEVEHCITISHTCSQYTYLCALDYYLLDSFYKHNPLFEDIIKEQLMNELTDSEISFIVFETKYRMCQCITDQNTRSQFLKDISDITDSEKLTNIESFFLLLLNKKEEYDFISRDLNKKSTGSIFYQSVKKGFWKQFKDYFLHKKIHYMAKKRPLRENLCIDDCLIDNQFIPDLLFYTREEYLNLLYRYKHIAMIFLESSAVIKYDPKIQAFMDIVSEDMPGCIVFNPSYYYKSEKNEESGFLNIKLQYSNKTKILLIENEIKILSCTDRYEMICVSPAGDLFVNGRKKCYPLSFKKAHHLMKQNPIFKEKMEKYFVFCAENNLFVRDILSDCEKECLLPIKVADIFLYHNRREYIEKNFKTAFGIKIKWNKYNLNLSYLLIKSLPYIEKESRNILLSAITSLSYDEIALVCKETNTIKANICNFLEQIIIKKCSLNTDNSNEMQMLKDYVSMCIDDKFEKICLKMNTYSGLVKKHDILSKKIFA